MRILQVHSRSRTRGGADQVMSDEASMLTGAGHTVERLEFDPVGERAGLREAADVVWNRRAGREVGRFVADWRPDIVHVHSPYPLLSPVVFRAASTAGAATVTTLHNYRQVCVVGTCLRDGALCFDCVGKTIKTPGVRHACYHESRAASAAMALSLAAHRMAGTFHRHVHRYLALTHYARDLMVRDGYPAERIGVVDNSVRDPGAPGGRLGPFTYAVFIGRFVPEKGVATLLKAWQGLDIALRIAGDGPGRAAVEQAARQHPRITYVGWLGTDAQERLLSGADALVFPSLWLEGQPLVLLQAMAHGVPVVCSDIANIEETAVAHGGGVTFSTGDPASLAAVVGRLAAEPDEARRLGAAGRSAYERLHTPARVCEQLLQEYDRALATRRGAMP